MEQPLQAWELLLELEFEALAHVEAEDAHHLLDLDQVVGEVVLEVHVLGGGQQVLQIVGERLLPARHETVDQHVLLALDNRHQIVVLKVVPL